MDFVSFLANLSRFFSSAFLDLALFLGIKYHFTGKLFMFLARIPESPQGGPMMK